MKKIVLSLLAVALMSFGLVGGAAPAQAAPYPNTVVVQPAAAKTKAKVNKKAKIALASVGNVGVPTGVAKTVCKNKGTKVKKTAPLNAAGKAKTGKLAKKGKWKCKVTYTPTANSVFKATQFKTKVKVK